MAWHTIHWNDLAQQDLVRCGIEQDWCEFAQDRSACQGVLQMAVNSLNEEAEKKDDKMKDEKKRKQQSQLAAAHNTLICDHPNCCFVAVNHSGLVNRKCQKHAPPKSTLRKNISHLRTVQS